jgi:large subunit ribosomal protein L23
MPAGKHYADVLVAPLISEKSNDLMIDMNKYVFTVAPRATKNDVARAISEKYNVAVKHVNLINLPGKPKRVGRYKFESQIRRKAVITLAPGEKIADLTEAV